MTRVSDRLTVSTWVSCSSGTGRLIRCLQMPPCQTADAELNHTSGAANRFKTALQQHFCCTSTSAYGWSGATLPPSGMVYRTSFPGLGLVSWLGSTCKGFSSAGVELKQHCGYCLLLEVICYTINVAFLLPMLSDQGTVNCCNQQVLQSACRICQGYASHSCNIRVASRGVRACAPRWRAGR